MKTSNPKLQAPNPTGSGDWCPVILWSLVVGFWCFSLNTPLFAATNAADLDEIPPLRPPRPEIPPTFWEQRGSLVVVGCAALFALAGVAVWFWSRPKSPRVVPPEVLARQALEQLRQRPEDGVVLSWVSQILRHYTGSAFGWKPGELTTAEFCDLIARDEKVGQDLAKAMAEFLRTCDERKFAPATPAPALGAVSQALALIDRAEVRRAVLIEAAVASGADPTVRASQPK